MIYSKWNGDGGYHPEICWPGGNPAKEKEKEKEEEKKEEFIEEEEFKV